MILKNSWGKYDSLWVIGDIRLERDPGFRVEGGSKKETYLYEGIQGADKYMQRGDVSEFQRIVFSILDEHIKNGTRTLTCLDLAVQYCMRLGMFDDVYRSNQISAFIDEIKAMTEEKDGFRYREVLCIIGGSVDNISADGMEFIKRRTYEKLVAEHIPPKHIWNDEKHYAIREFYRNLRYTVTALILGGVFAEIPV